MSMLNFLSSIYDVNKFYNVFVILFLTRVIERWLNGTITRVKKRITKTLLNSASYATHKQISDHSVKRYVN